MVESKNILLFKEMLSDIGYDDIGVADLLVTVLRLVGAVLRAGA